MIGIKEGKLHLLADNTNLLIVTTNLYYVLVALPQMPSVVA